MNNALRALVAASLILFTATDAEAQRKKPPVPDLTADGVPDDKHDWNLGATGARGWIWGWKLETLDARQVLITDVAPDSPADGVLRVGDVLLGIGKEPFAGDPRRALGEALVAAQSQEGRGRLGLLLWRAGKTRSVKLRLPVLGDFSSTAPWDCDRSAKVFDAACEHIAGHMKGDIDGMINALALLASGKKEYRGAVAKLAHEVGPLGLELTLEGQTSGLVAWKWGYRNLFLTEYVLATGDESVMPAIVEYSETIARGQSGIGTWGHGMAWPDLNEGRLHGRLGGYGALNQSGLICHLSLVLARMCGVQSEEVDMAIHKANDFAAFYAGKGAIPYGDHRPGWKFHDDNGKNSVAAIIFDLQGRDEEAKFFSKMTVASYGERERGHTGNYFSMLWGALGAGRAGPLATGAFLRERRWYRALARSHDGSFGYQGGAGMSGSEHKYGGWDCTGAFVLSSALPLEKLYITGRGRTKTGDLGPAEVDACVEAGRGFDSWSMAAPYYKSKDTNELVALLSSWSPAVRTRAAVALAKKPSAPVEELIERLASGSMDTRYGAAQALGALGERGGPAVASLTETLGESDVWLRIQAAYALSAIGKPAASAVPALLRLALQSDPQDPREYTQRFLAFCLFYRGGSLGKRGLIAKSLDGVDRELLLPAIERLLLNDDGRARAAVATVYKNLAPEEIAPLLPAVLEAIRTPSPSGVMFSNGIRFDGLDLLARLGVPEGMELALQIVDIQQWGKKDRIRRTLKVIGEYGAAAKAVLPELRDLKAQLESHREARNLKELAALCGERISAIEAAQ